MARKTTPKTKAFRYLRVSGQDQVGGDGFPRQRDATDRYAAQNKIEIVDEFRDEAVCGENELADRAGLSSLLERIAGNGVRLVLVENANRLARDLLVQETILAKFRAIGVVVQGADGVDLTVMDNDPTRVLIRQIFGAIAQFDKAMTVAKLRGARDRIRRKLGRCEGRKPFGSKPGESEVLARMQALARKPKLAERPPLASIAEQLNAEGLRNRSGGEWNKASVWKVLNSKK